MKTAHEVLVALAGRYAFGDVAALIADGAGGGRLTTRRMTGIGHLCAFGQGLLDLDAEDFGTADPPVIDPVTDDAVPRPLAQRAQASRMPQSPDEESRGALGSLVPAYRLLLEVIAVRWARREMAALVAAVHIASEYLPLLAWEPVLGHAGDPPRLIGFVTVADSRFGVAADRDCAHNGADRAGARRVPTGRESAASWRGYLDRHHSNVAHALGVCAAECTRHCGVMRQVSDVDTSSLRQRNRLALAFADTALVRLRHAAPVGHGFGVPSPEEVVDAWARSRGRLGSAAQDDDGYPLPGIPAFFSAIAGVALAPDTLLADTARALTHALSGTRARA